MSYAKPIGVATACLLLSLITNASGEVPNTTPDTQPREWPAVLTIDDFENGVGNWRNEDTGKLEWVDDAPGGKKALRWTAGDDGIGRIIFKTLDRTQIDFSQYQLLRFYFKTTGKPIWNIDPPARSHTTAPDATGGVRSDAPACPEPSWRPWRAWRRSPWPRCRPGRRRAGRAMPRQWR